jgi:hypothetical protein
MLTSVDNGRVRLDRMLNRGNLMNLFNFALKDWGSNNLGKGGGLDVGIYSKCEIPSKYEREEGIAIQVTLRASPITDTIVSPEPWMRLSMAATAVASPA